MTLHEALILGIVQGCTEFLPVSSSGHLVLFQQLFGLKESMLAFDILLHWGTLLAVLTYYWKDILMMTHDLCLVLSKKMSNLKAPFAFKEYPNSIPAVFTILAMVPTVLIALAFKDDFENMFSSLELVGWGWIFIGILMVWSKKLPEGERSIYLMNHRDAFLIGVMQGIAIIPSISRSGMTILAGILCGLEKKAAARFSFLLSIPAIVGAGVFKMKEIFAPIDCLEDVCTQVTLTPDVMIVGFLASAIIGYLSIIFLLRLIQAGNFFLFGIYCLLAGIGTLTYTTFFK